MEIVAYIISFLIIWLIGIFLMWLVSRFSAARPTFLGIIVAAFIAEFSRAVLQEFLSGWLFILALAIIVMIIMMKIIGLEGHYAFMGMIFYIGLELLIGITGFVTLLYSGGI